MDLVSELKPFQKEIELYETRGGLPQGDVKEKLIDIYHRFHKIKPNIGPATISKGCGSCIKDMMKALANNRREQFNMNPFKGITATSKANVEVKKVSPVDTGKSLEQLELAKLNPDEMKFPALKIACARYKIPFSPSTNKLELASLLKAYIDKHK